MRFGMPELLLLAVIVLVLFGPKRLPEVGRALGRSIAEFRAGLRGEGEPPDAPSAAVTPLI